MGKRIRQGMTAWLALALMLTACGHEVPDDIFAQQTPKPAVDIGEDPPGLGGVSGYGKEDDSERDESSGYDLDVEAGTGVLDSLLASYDQGTKVEMDVSAEAEAFVDAKEENTEPQYTMAPGSDSDFEVQDEPVAAVSAAAPLPLILKPEAPGICKMENSSCVIDYSYANDGYFMVRWTGPAGKIKVQSTGQSGITYTYDLFGDAWAAFPFSDGNGIYAIRVMQNVGGTKYAVAGSIDIDVSLVDEFAPFLRPNQYVNYENADNVTAQASECCRGTSDELEKVAAIYDWVVASLTYDYDKAATVQSGYLPDLEQVYAARKGICFDYASLMAGMLRSQGVACRLVIGYAGKAYHAWISVYVPGTGWVDGVVFFDGTSWQRMDPTFASSAAGDPAILAYIGDGSNYSARYLY